MIGAAADLQQDIAVAGSSAASLSRAELLSRYRRSEKSANNIIPRGHISGPEAS
jgi:hypothetical protein